MNEEFMDQASGLRRLFHAAPPDVMAIVSCGAATTPWVARQLLARSRAGRQLLALDEWSACGNLADCLNVSARFDLLQVVEGHVPLANCLVEAIPGLKLAPVSRLSQFLGTDRLINQRTVAQFRQMQPGFDEWLVMARSCDISGLSPLALAAPRLLLVIDEHPMSVTEAYATLKRHASKVAGLLVSLCHVSERDAASTALLGNFRAVARTQLGVSVEVVGSIGEALLMGAREGGVSADAFIDRLAQTSRGAANHRLVSTLHR